MLLYSRFQFLIVRLKFSPLAFRAEYSLFQFLIVRLKFWGDELLFLDTLKFQFLIVRLKLLNFG